MSADHPTERRCGVRARAIARVRVTVAFLVLAALTFAAGVALPRLAAAAQPQGPLVFAAASLGGALDEVAADYAQGGDVRPRISYASSGTLARQISQGAPADVFISADEKWMDYLAARHLIDAKSRVPLLGNSLVLIVPATAPVHIRIARGFALSKLLGADGRLAMGDPASVPAGIYGKAALEYLGVWDQVEKRVVRAENVRAALVFVERGEAAAGIVYSTDAAASQHVVIAGEFPAASHPPISYPFALVGAHPSADARKFFTYLRSAAALKVFASHGFITR